VNQARESRKIEDDAILMPFEKDPSATSTPGIV
jgi:hypothetical protein